MKQQATSFKLRHFVAGHFVAGHFVAGHFVRAASNKLRHFVAGKKIFLTVIFMSQSFKQQAATLCIFRI